jgi:hypothetical protein
MTNRPFSILEKVAATRAVMSVLKRVAEAKPEAAPSAVWKATRLAVNTKLGNLLNKQDAGVKMTETQLSAIAALECADTLLISFGTMFGDDDTTRMLEPEEVQVLQAIAKKRKDAAAASAAKRKEAKAKAAVKPAKADKKQLEFAAA